MHANLKARAGLSQLIIVDMQTRLIAAMPQEALQATIKNAGILAQAASLLEVPTIITEQYPKGLGNTVPELQAILPSIKPVEKICFSCLAEPKFNRQLTGDHTQMVLVGMEAHICILQTALDLIGAGKQVFIAEDAIISRNPANKTNALTRLRDAGCIVSNTESIVFEWLGKAEGDAFKAISKLIR
ncbi:isochorismatase family protein [Methylotenera sp.]|jgi:nicotinamidase-related amidase|uniref:isochorismatase family protein n=1 Tax=Methylotenera sp. TaxID=2051956 RepID=UPI0027292326|nr:isochorismatase family protein [Methylotenera sp.]MDO9204049.1 isochorismatase family protein [Methylotenera sp.]MDP3819171.1 isochorismatase family protein [Methylotenera sp.]MDZ4210180.1 isochorismatase family protein [Methylotenera sp.]